VRTPIQRFLLRSLWPAAVASGLLASHAAPVFAQTTALSAPIKPLVVVTTIKPIHALAAAVLGDVAKPELLIDGVGSPHTYALKPSQVRLLNDANAVIMVSSDLETFMDKLAASLPKSVAIVKLDQTPGIERLPLREGGLFEAHDHADEPGKGARGHGHHHHGEGHAHGSNAKSGGKPPAKGKAAPPAQAMDAHLWLDPQNAKAIVSHLARTLSDLSPAHRATFETNASAAMARLDALQEEIARDLQSVGGKPFIVFHDAYQYFERRFGLKAAGSITLNPEVQPGAKRIKALRGRLQAGGAVCLFAEPQFAPKIVTTLIEGTKVRKGTLDPIGVALTPGAGAYEGLLRGLANDLRTCLGGTS
jgi:zinc transport system substrate-binding protein